MFQPIRSSATSPCCSLSLSRPTPSFSGGSFWRFCSRPSTSKATSWSRWRGKCWKRIRGCELRSTTCWRRIRRLPRTLGATAVVLRKNAVLRRSELRGWHVRRRRQQSVLLLRAAVSGFAATAAFPASDANSATTASASSTPAPLAAGTLSEGVRACARKGQLE